MNQPKTTRIPAPLYAAAGAGDLAYQQLRKLPAVVTELSGKAAASTVELREKAAARLRTANTTAATLRGKAAGGELDVDRLREAAARNAAVVMAGAQLAQERAVAAYTALVARGERVVGSGAVRAADTVDADLVATQAPAAVAAAVTDVVVADVAVSDVAAADETKPATRTARPTKPAARSATTAARPTKSATRSTTSATAAAKPAARSAKPARRPRSTGTE